MVSAMLVDSEMYDKSDFRKFNLINQSFLGLIGRPIGPASWIGRETSDSLPCPLEYLKYQPFLYKNTLDGRPT